uniref:NADH-ubiquinone oxidoreductase chain 4L n=1 Tax=Gorpis annulatus TaxID=696245 RepID=K7NBU7_9HEMI|nr:NADH dehydrogenase subunit 4L [Gorpis annulatus]AEI53351.1 NADH dehydrogenase subunit 4L [Gorpis annulatus]
MYFNSNFMEYTVITMFIISMFTFCLVFKHLLMTLLSMEFLVLTNFFLFFMFLDNYGCGFYIIMLFLTFSVCEACLGLAILVSLIRCHGNDMIMSLNPLLW